MNTIIEDFIKKDMALIPEGIETIRRFVDDKKWISSNYRMSIPSQGNNQSVSLEEVRLDMFYMSKYPITNAFYDLIMNKSSRKTDNNHCPKVDISWLEAIEFCNTVSLYFNAQPCYHINSDRDVSIILDADGFRLPTDAQWQYACRGGKNTYQYDDINDIAWHTGNAKEKLQAVGLKKPNDYGLYDMLGNVWEWCFDLYNEETYDHYRIFRGGSFGEESRICGATTRRKSLPTFSIDDLGFRLVKPI